MKKLLPWLCLVATTSAYSADGLDAYRQGLYSLAAETLPKEMDKNPVALYYYGRMWLYGFGELKNNNLALSFFTKAAEKGYLPAQKLLGEYYLIYAKSPETALLWFKKAAEQSDISAQLYCAAAYLYGVGAKLNTDIAKRYLIDAAKNGSAIGQYTLAEQFLESRDSQNKKLGVIWLTKAANQNNPIAQRKLGILYATGQVVSKDPIKAKELLTAAAKVDVAAMIFLSLEAQKEGSYSEAKGWLTKALETNDLSAEVAMANFLQDEKNPEHNDKEAFLLFLKAAQAGSVEAQERVALLYKEGKGIEANENLSKQWEETAAKTMKSISAEKKAALWLSNGKNDTFATAGYPLMGIYTAWTNPLALKQNHYNASPQMPMVYRNEIYKPQFVMASPAEIPISDYFSVLAPLLNPDKDEKWTFPRYSIDKKINSVIRNESLVLKHEQGSFIIDDEANYLSQSPEIYGFNYFAEKTKDFDHQINLQAVLSELYGQAILGVPSAQFQIGQLYQYGIGVSQNIEQALIYYQLAAIQQDVRAEYNLGILYLEGKTNPVNYAQGIQWMTTAAFKGNAYAQYVLANLYDHGLKDNQGNEVVKPNHAQAVAMYYLASANHYGEAEYKLANLLVNDKSANQSMAAVTERTNLVKQLYAGAAKRGVAEAILPLAFYNAMDKDPNKQASALRVARLEADTGNPEAALLLAIMLDRGIGTIPNQEEALTWYQKAASNPVSNFILGTYYSEGKNLEKNVMKGRALLQAASEAGFSYGDLNLAILKQQAGEHFIDDLNKARESGNAKAGILLADYYLSEANNPENMAQARSIYQHFAEKGDKNAELKLGFLFERGLGGEANLTMASRWYSQAAEQGQPMAQYLLGHMYQMGQMDNETNYPQAKAWYQKASQNYPNASVALGFIYDTVDDNYAKALEHYQKAAANGNSIASYNLGLIYQDGKGIAVDNAKAKECYAKSAEAGISSAMTQLASIYFQEQNIKEASNWYNKAASLNDPEALYDMGLLNETGVGTQRDPAAAINYYQTAAQKGNEKAKFALARMLQYGLGVPKNLDKAKALYQELAANYNANAQYQLGLIYLKETDNLGLVAEGKKLLQEASTNGNVQAQKSLGMLNNTEEGSQGSVIASIQMNQGALTSNTPAEMMYFDAINAWDRGDEALSRKILDKLLAQYPDYMPAKQTMTQFDQAKAGK